MKYIQYLLPLVLLMPNITFAAGEFEGLGTFLKNITDFLNETIVPLVFAIAFLVFIWGIFVYFIQGGDDDGKRKEGRNLMLYGIIGFVVMLSVWGIVNLLVAGLALDGDTLDQNRIPQAPTEDVR